MIYHRQGEAPPQYLLLDYGRHWDYPKGHVEKGEDDLGAASRELQEETGITDIRVIGDFQHAIQYFFRDRKHRLIHKSVVFFLAETPTREVVLSKEHVGFVFLGYEEALRLLTFPSAREILRLANAHLHGKHATPSESDTMSRR